MSPRRASWLTHPQLRQNLSLKTPQRPLGEHNWNSANTPQQTRRQVNDRCFHFVLFRKILDYLGEPPKSTSPERWGWLHRRLGGSGLADYNRFQLPPAQRKWRPSLISGHKCHRPRRQSDSNPLNHPTLSGDTCRHRVSPPLDSINILGITALFPKSQQTRMNFIIGKQGPVDAFGSFLMLAASTASPPQQLFCPTLIYNGSGSPLWKKTRKRYSRRDVSLDQAGDHIHRGSLCRKDQMYSRCRAFELFVRSAPPLSCRRSSSCQQTHQSRPI